MDSKRKLEISKTELETDPLTPKQRKFVNELVLNDTQLSSEQCAVNAGYSKTCASKMASYLQNPKYYPKVALEIQNFRNQINKRYAVEKGSHLRQLARLRDGAVEKGQYGPAVVAEYRRGQIAGLYIEKKVSLTGSIDNLTREQAVKKFKELMEENPRLIDNLSYEEVVDVEEKNLPNGSKRLLDNKTEHSPNGSEKLTDVKTEKKIENQAKKVGT
jgi:hypothetical protein